jgi:glutamate synthase (NADPH/NADH) small chain
MKDLELNRWGNIEVNENNRTSIHNVWAGGDIVTGAATVISAMGAGRIAATSMHAYLMGQPQPERTEE